jgi:hypothetical protein
MGENRRPRGGRSSPNANRCLHTQLSLREPPDPHTCAVCAVLLPGEQHWRRDALVAVSAGSSVSLSLWLS